MITHRSLRHPLALTTSLFLYLFLPLLTAFAGSGILEVESNPGGAQVYVDGKRKGDTPGTEGKSLAMKLPEGDHTVELRKEGYENASKKVFVGDGVTQPVTMALTREAFTNDLGMRFVPVPIKGGPSDGENLLFSVWETRVKDFGSFVDATDYDAKTDSDGKRMSEHWQSPGFKQTGDHPVVFVNWNDARAFCNWLTEKERNTGQIKGSQHYRLPTDHEWSCAVGIGDRESASSSPMSKSRAIDYVFPWGTDWPPRRVVGSFRGKEVSAKREIPSDGFRYTAPVGRFPASATGLHDLDGNVSEWIADKWESSSSSHVLRGGTFYDYQRTQFLSSFRSECDPTNRKLNFGFRCVLSGEEAR